MIKIENFSVFIYFIYGLSFYTMGICAWIQKSNKHSGLPLVRSIRYLGYFGIIHGTVEWLIMILLLNIFSDDNKYLGDTIVILNALSFVFLWIFGISLFQNNSKKIKLSWKLPITIFAIWFLYITVLMMSDNIDFIIRLELEKITLRYFIGLPGAMITAFALFKSSKAFSFSKLKGIQNLAA